MSSNSKSGATDGAQNSRTVVATRHYASTIERAFKAWTDPVLLQQWFGPPGTQATVLDHELKTDGRWKIRMDVGDGQFFHHFGTFLEVSEPDRLIFTWASEEQINGWRDVDGNPTIVTVDFLADNKGVEVTITHENLISDVAFNSLTYGWNGTLDRLHEMGP